MKEEAPSQGNEGGAATANGVNGHAGAPETLSQSDRRTVSDPSIPEHQLELHQTGWAVWRWICLRGAGFPYRILNDLAAPECSRTIDDLLQCERGFEASRNEVLQAIRSELVTVSDVQRRRDLAGLITQLNKSKVPAAKDLFPHSAWQKLQEALSRRDQLKDQYHKLFSGELAEISSRVQKITCDPRFREAVLLQNRDALKVGIDALKESENGKRDKKQRQREELVASYLQRYCAKNDSIGFFGPLGWAKAVKHGPAMTALPGPDLVSASTIYFEHWCIQALADEIARKEGMRVWFVPRPMPAFFLQGNTLYVPGGSIPLTAVQAAVLNLCSGGRTAKDIARTALAAPGSRFQKENEIYEVLEQFVKRGILRWELEVPIDLNPDRTLQRMLERIGDEGLRTSSLGMLNELVRKRDAVARATEEHAKLDEALCDLDETFLRLTGKAPTHASGKMYAARTLVYQDCRRDIDVRVGPEILERLGEPLSLILASARWFTHRAAELYRERFQKLYQELASKLRTRTVDLVTFWTQAQPFLTDEDKLLFHEIVPEYQSAWNSIFQLDFSQRQVSFTSQELRAKVIEAFPAPRAGWQLARYHSPDVMIAAPSVEAINQGDYTLVLGEVHLASNTLRGYFAMAQHPCPDEMFTAFKTDLPMSRILPVIPNSQPKVTVRTSLSLISPRDYHLEQTPDSMSRGPRSRTLPLAAFVLESTPSGLIARTRDGQMRFDLVEFCGELLSANAVDFMKFSGAERHSPRVTIDRVVVRRESWKLAAREIDFVNENDETTRFLAARRWAQRNNLSRYVFYKIAAEVKPFFIDFDAPVYVEIFCKVVRRAIAADGPDATVGLSEMLPRPDQLWLPDASGQRYTGELRMVIFDRQY
jgi:hypothetical protein